MSLIDFISYVIFCSMMVFTPGPMTMLLMSISVECGIKRTMLAQMGASSAYLVSLFIFTVGLTALLQQYVIVLKIIQYVGVSYILYLAWMQWQNAKKINLKTTVIHMKKSTSIELYWKGLITGISNPKTIVMFSTVLPQFANNPSTKILDVTILSITFLLLQFLSGLTYSYFGKAIQKLLHDEKYRKVIYRTISFLLLLVAVMMAIQ